MLNELFAYKEGSNSLVFVIAAFAVGMLIGCIYMLYEIKVPGKIVRTLDRSGARSEEDAQGADALGMTEKKLMRLTRPSGVLGKYVKNCGEDGAKRFYLAPQTADRAAIRYDRKKASTGTVVVCVLLIAALAAILVFVIPELMQMLRNFLSMFRSDV